MLGARKANSKETDMDAGRQLGAEVRDKVEQSAVQAAPWVERLARFGYAAKGVVYVIIGILALQLAFGQGGEATGPEGALDTIGRQPFGRTLLAVMAVGLLSYALWRFVQAALDPEDKGRDAKGLAQRAGYVVSGLTYGALGLLAGRMALGAASGEDGGGAQDWTAWLLAQPLGVWLVALAGLIVIGAGLYQLYYGLSGKFRDELKLHAMSRTEQTWATRSGRLGYAARGVVYAITGGFLVLAALRSDPQQAGGIGKALGELARQPYGPWLLGVVALGVLCYGIYAFVQARYRRISAT
jgi:hypothetical protein